MSYEDVEDEVLRAPLGAAGGPLQSRAWLRGSGSCSPSPLRSLPRPGLLPPRPCPIPSLPHAFRRHTALVTLVLRVRAECHVVCDFKAPWRHWQTRKHSPTHLPPPPLLTGPLMGPAPAPTFRKWAPAMKHQGHPGEIFQVEQLGESGLELLLRPTWQHGCPWPRVASAVTQQSMHD